MQVDLGPVVQLWNWLTFRTSDYHVQIVAATMICPNRYQNCHAEGNSVCIGDQDGVQNGYTVVALFFSPFILDALGKYYAKVACNKNGGHPALHGTFRRRD